MTHSPPDAADLFPGFVSHWIDTEAGRIFARSAGSGPPLVLLHGFPESHVMWHRVAPGLASRFTTVVMDLRGYGWSSAPASTGGALYAKREMGRDVVTAMEALGHVRFRLAGHDRGARVGYRLALDHPGRIEKLALLDILPTMQVWANIRAGVTPPAHWGLLAGSAPGPETEIASGPDAYFEGLMTKWTQAQSLAAFDARALASYRAAWGDRSRIHAMCEDYRAGATIDVAADEADLAAGRQIACPVLVATGDFYLTRGARESAGDTWRRTFAPQAQAALLDSGHFLAEENAPATLDALLAFL
jgi:haloacetate dehalogenase